MRLFFAEAGGGGGRRDSWLGWLERFLRCCFYYS